MEKSIKHILNDVLKSQPMLVYLFGVTFLYVIWQISLCGAILSASSIEESQRLSDLAKITVGIGTALLAFRLGYKHLRYLIIIPLSCMLGFGAMETEDYIVNNLASNTTAKERLEAKSIQLFSLALTQDKVTLNDMPQDIMTDPVKLKAFSKILGLAIWQNPALINDISKKTPALFTALYGQEIYDKIDAEYDIYVEKIQSYADKLQDMEYALQNFNYASLAVDLNSQLDDYAVCRTEKCKQKITTRVQKYISKKFSGIPFTLVLDDFCKNVTKSNSYYMGRPIATNSELSCGTSEQGLYAYMKTQIEKIKENAIQNIDIPEEVKPHLLSSKILTLDDWRNVWKAYTNKSIAQQEKEAFENPEKYGEDGNLAQEGREYAVSIFLPPIALGFSVTVCFLHIISMCAVLTKCPRLCSTLGCVIYFLPAVFATSVPINGFAGIYATWLVFWQSFIYPMGILKNLIL